ncbi:hypothetical protein FNV43_RR00636 [Rhamnella rubrinervis]|uniref:Uncharacterized protein n=1 Tax=Rhamnella rubrinervis TaxID=2594499 RepID=A0A8K0MS75_9ROSA|nr:hypothetical protein FNV43_RR00636 [Rhamnella rubrinervis]
MALSSTAVNAVDSKMGSPIGVQQRRFSWSVWLHHLYIGSLGEVPVIFDALLIIGLPDRPNAHFKLSRLVLRKDIKVCPSLKVAQ